MQQLNSFSDLAPCPFCVGIQTAHAVCKDLDFNWELPDSYCSPEKPTPIVRRCGSEECTPRSVPYSTIENILPDDHSWTSHIRARQPVLKWSKCIYRFSLYQISHISTGYTYRWFSSEWGLCSETTCGTGLQQRLVQCRMLESSGRDRVVSDELCDGVSRPDHERECVMRDSSGCDTAWQVEEWGQVRGREGGE